mgnify:CR=1 FL=1
MIKNQTIEIAVPDGTHLSAADLAVLRSAGEALVEKYCQLPTGSTVQIAAMSEEGWLVQTGLTWVARAERGRKSEEAVGLTKGEALCRLCQLTGLHAVDGCP